MTEHADIKDWLDKPLRQYIQSLPSKTLPRIGVLKDQFFDQAVQDVIEATDADLQTQTQFISGMGPLGESALLRLIDQLRTATSD
jgi:hypothetical protein